MNDAIRLDTDREGFEGFLESVILNGARMNLEKAGNVRPVVILIANQDPQTKELYDPPRLLPIITPGDFNNPAVKDIFAMAVREIAGQSDAFSAILISEAWLTHEGSGLEGPDLEEKIRKAGGVGNLPEAERREVVIVLVEHRQFGNRQYYAQIIREEDGVELASPKLGPFDTMGEWQSLKFGGRLTGFLPAPPKTGMH